MAPRPGSGAMHGLSLAQAAPPSIAGVPLDAIAMYLAVALLAAVVLWDARKRLRRSA